MMDYNSQIRHAPVLSLHAGAPIAVLGDPIIIPTLLQIAGFFITSPLLDKKSRHILQSSSVREIGKQGFIINSIDDISPETDLLRMKAVLELDFDLFSCTVQTENGTKLGTVVNFICDGFLRINQIVVKPPILRSLSGQKLFIPRTAITRIENGRIIVKDLTLKTAPTKIPAKLNPDFINPFAKSPKPLLSPNQN
ncbi:MAG: PRC-barrel domain-containing protein [Candidatus Nomurabacteria bacterium]|jgi:hypothetical protein|nr:PRC-barrel domain-containing protein [Candidatus Nomurabacteria bacterium]